MTRRPPLAPGGLSPEQLETWSTAKGWAFVAVPALGLHAGLRWALARRPAGGTAVTARLPVPGPAEAT